MIQTSHLQPNSFQARFGNAVPKVARRFEVDLSEASPEHRPIILRAIREFNDSSFARKANLDNIPTNIKIGFASEGTHLAIYDENTEGTILLLVHVTDVNQDNIYLGIGDVIQKLQTRRWP